MLALALDDLLAASTRGGGVEVGKLDRFVVDRRHPVQAHLAVEALEASLAGIVE